MRSLFVVLVPLFCAVSCMPAKRLHDDETKTNQIGDLSKKLARLKTMDLQKDEETIYHHTEEDKISEPDTASKHVVTSQSDSIDEPTDDGMDSPSTDDEHIVNMKKYVSSLTPRELETLRVLKKVLDLRKARHEEEDKGTFSEHELMDDKGEGIQMTYTSAGPKQRPPKRDDMDRDSDDVDEDGLIRVSDDGVSVPVHTEEGNFGAFRDEIKHSVEKNLLADITLAVHAGISVNEILEDLKHTTEIDMDDEIAPPKKLLPRD